MPTPNRRPFEQTFAPGMRPQIPQSPVITPQAPPQAPAARSEWDTLMSRVAPRGRAARAESEIYLGPEAIANDTNRLFELMMGSPMFQSMLRGIMQSGSQMQTGFQSALGRTGLSGSGVGAAASGLAKSATGNAISGARGDMFAQALQTALQALQSRMQMAPTFMEERRAGPSVLEQIGGGIAGGARAVGNFGQGVAGMRRPQRRSDD